MHLLIDMNLSPQWSEVLTTAGFSATHWSDIGRADAADQVIFHYAQEHEMVVFTHDLDFGDILAATGADSPSVIQIRTDDPTPQSMKEAVIAALHQFQSELSAGALIVVDPEKIRARILPIQ